MFHLFLFLAQKMQVGHAIAATLGITAAGTATAGILVTEWDAIREIIWKASATATNLLAEAIEAEDEDDPIMPTEYASWASAEMWRKSCIRPGDRRM